MSRKTLTKSKIRKLVEEEIQKMMREQDEDYPDRVKEFITKIGIRPKNIQAHNTLSKSSGDILHEIYISSSRDIEIPVKPINDAGYFEIEKVALYGNEFYVQFWAPNR